MNICGIGRAVSPISNLPNAYISKEPGEAQKELGIEKEASYIISVINPKKPAVAIDSFCLVLMLRQSSLMDKEWWNKIWCNELGLSSVPDEKTLLMMRNGFSQFYVIGFFHSLFSAIESAFWIYLREIDPVACNNGTAEYEAIYNSLFKKLKLQQRQDYIELLDLLRHIRNTIHNNGVYFHKSGLDKTLPYKGKKYNFEIGKPVEYHGGVLNFLLYLMPNILKMIEDVVYSSDIISRQKIIDPLVD
jgi:hypothetical protein